MKSCAKKTRIYREEKEIPRYELKQMLGKIFKPGVKPEPDVSRPKRGALCGQSQTARRDFGIFDLNLTHPSFLAFNTEQAQNGASIYEGIKQSIHHSPCVNADETGWRVNGQNHWLWVFTNKDAALYQIDKSRGSKVVDNILGKEYHGVLISDFYSAYNKLQSLACKRCLGASSG